MRRELLAATALSSAALGIWSAGAWAQTPTAYSWTGFYVGAGVGGHFDDNAATLDLPDGDPADFDIVFDGGAPIFPGQASDPLDPWQTSYDLDDLKPAVGAFLGYNYQIGRTVLGIEADGFWLGDRSSDSYFDEDVFTDGAPTVTRTTNVEVSGGVETLFTLRPRVGVVASDRLLLFGTGGLAIGDVSLSSSASIAEAYSDASKSAAAEWAGEESSWELGYTVGGGAEYAITDRATVRLEALYYNLGDFSATIEGSGSETDGGGTDPLTAQPYTAQMEMDGAIARLGVSFRF